MKKNLLFGVAAFAFLAANAQAQNGRKVMMPAKSSLKAYKYEKAIPDVAGVIDDSYKSANTTKPVIKSSKSDATKKVASTTQTIIGKTWYDLQSNSSVGDRIVLNDDGSIAACWTIEPGVNDPGTSYANRGTGYNYYNGSAWGPMPAGRIENVRVGWGNIVNTRSGADVVLSHGATAGNAVNIATRTTAGSGTWSNNTSAFPVVTGGNLWPRMVSSSPSGGDTLYEISISSPVLNNGTIYNGQDGALLFSRSFDGGATWSANVVPTGLDASTFLGFGGDSYAIAAHGSTVAIVAGGVDANVALVKSVDAGATWTVNRTIYQFPMPLYDSQTAISDIDNDGFQDTVLTNDGIFSIALDNANSAHVFFGRTYMTGDGSTGTFTFYGVDGLCYWNESMPDGVANQDPDILSSSAILVAGVIDLNGNNQIDDGQPSAGVGYGKFRGSLTSYPSCAFDDQNNLYLSYASLNDTLRSFINTDKNVRHIYVTKRLANATNPDDFCTPVELDLFGPSSPDIFEGMYASMAKRIDGNVHLVYMRDYAVGHGVPPSSGVNDDQIDNHLQASEIVYAKIPVGDIGGCPLVTGIQEISSPVANLRLYPNPASTSVKMDVQLADNAKLDISILNTVGQTVYSTSVYGVSGNNTVELNLDNLTSGLYFYQIKAGNSKAITKKFAIGK
jgi:hypothetical protein